MAAPVANIPTAASMRQSIEEGAKPGKAIAL
jgi:hypothetical protein